MANFPLLLLFSCVATTAGLANSVAAPKNSRNSSTGSSRLHSASQGSASSLRLRRASQRLSARVFAKSVQFKHKLRVCNAYPSELGLDIYKGHDETKSNVEMFTGEKKLTKLPLEYKMCGDFTPGLHAGDKLKFMLGGGNAGTFVVSALPNSDAVLLLVIHRHDVRSNAVAFQSHVFANLFNAQVAVIDTYKGVARGYAEIASVTKRETLKYNSLMALNPGVYKVSLVDSPMAEDRKGTLRNHVGRFFKKKIAAESLVALNRESYVVIRVGLETQQGPQYPQDLVIYPDSESHWLRSNSQGSAVQIWALMCVLAIAVLHQ